MSWRIFSSMIAVLLMITAFLKAKVLMSDPYQNVIFAPWIQALAISFEFGLAFWLLSGWQANMAKRVTTITFSVLALVSLYLVWIGQTSCGCLGEIKVSPWWSFGLDVAIAISTLFFRPQENLFSSRDLGQIGIGSSVIVGLVGVGLFTLSSNPSVLLASVQGRSLVVVPGVVDLGADKVGAKRNFKVEVKNLSNKVVTVSGGTAGCGCVATKSLPVTIPPNGTVEVEVVVTFKGTHGVFSRDFVLYSDTSERLTKTRFSGVVIE